MPWDVKKNGSRWCVYKKGESTPIAGGCHATKGEARQQQKALYASEARRGMSEVNCFVSFAEKATVEDGLLWVEALPAKTWHDPRYGEVPITREKLENFVKNFNDNVRGQEVTTDYEHGMDAAKGRKASGTYRKLDIRDRDDGTVTLFAGIEPTNTALEEIKAKEWKYFSLEWEDEWTHPETQTVHSDVITGGALTNRPVAKGMLPINFSEVFVEVDHKNETIEHQITEPGTDGTRIPEVEPPNDDDSFGDRTPTPPPGNDDVHSDSYEGGELMNEEQLVELRKTLELPEDADADAILVGAKGMSEELQPLRDLRKNIDDKRKFAEEYPAEAERLATLEERDQERFAKQFSETFAEARVKRTVGEGDDVKEEPTTLGFSGLVVNEIETMARQFSEGKPTMEGFKGVLDAIMANGIVDYGNKGSELSPENDEPEIIPTAGSQDARKRFSEKVDEIMAKDEVDFDTALETAAKLHPKLAEAWRQPPVAAG